MDKRFLAILTAIIVLFVGIVAFQKNDNQNSQGSQSQTGGSSNHIKGQGAKKVTLVEYGDYQCPVCEGYEPVVSQVVNKNLNDIYFQFRNLPLSSIHPNAFAAARAAEAAALQSKFWEMHDALYTPSNWQTWTNSQNARPLFEQYAQQLSLDMTRFKQDFESNQVNNIVNADIAEFNKTGRQLSTPSFFINGRYIELNQLTNDNNQPSVDKFQAVLDAEFKKQ